MVCGAKARVIVCENESIKMHDEWVFLFFIIQTHSREEQQRKVEIVLERKMKTRENKMKHNM